MIFDSRTQLRASISAVKSTSTRTTSWHAKAARLQANAAVLQPVCTNEIGARITSAPRAHACINGVQPWHKKDQKGSASQVTSQLWSIQTLVCRHSGQLFALFALKSLAFASSPKSRRYFLREPKRAKNAGSSMQLGKYVYIYIYIIYIFDVHSVFSNNIITFFLAIIVIFTCWR